MPKLDEERLAIADEVSNKLAEERTLSVIQARAFVRCLQTEWNVDIIRWEARESQTQLRDAMRVLHAAGIFRAIEGTASTRAQACYRRAGELLEWLARAGDAIQFAAPITLLAAGAYQLGGLPAMAAGLIGQAEDADPGTALYGSFLRADFNAVLRETELFWRQNIQLTRRAEAEAFLTDGEGVHLSWYLTVELVRTLGLVADSFRRGDAERAETGLQKLIALDQATLRGAGPDAALLVSLLCQVALGFRDASIYRPLNELAALRPDKADRLRAIGRGQFHRGRGVLWASQARGLERLLAQSSFAMCTPTGSGKTLVANLALVKELLLRDADELLAPLALYLVPSRALAGEVETKLSREMKDEFLVTGLYGGTDWGITDAWLTADQPTVLVATVEKADALMRYLGPFLVPRLKLLIVDEAHQVVPDDKGFTQAAFAGHTERSIRLEAFVSRLLAQSPDIARVALTAVAGGAAGPVARWIEGRAEASPVGLNYRSTRQLVGILRTRPGQAARMQIDLMNGRPLRVRERGAIYINLRTPPMPQLPAAMRNSLNRFNQTDVLWTALHLKADKRRILISVAQRPERTIQWYREALELPAWIEAAQFVQPDEGGDRDLYNEAVEACADYCGEGSHEAALLHCGIATSHGQMPQRLRRLMTALIERGICPITVATATLTEGVNLPFDLIFVPQLGRRTFDATSETSDVTLMTASEFNNLAGRAGRPGAAKGLEGITLVAIPSGPSATASRTIPTQERQIEEMRADYRALRQSLLRAGDEGQAVDSPLALLLSTLAEQARRVLGVNHPEFLDWLEASLPYHVAADAGQGAGGERAKLADTLDELDSVLLGALEELARLEEDGDAARREAFLIDLWRRTFTAFAAEQEAWLEAAFVRRGKAIVETLYSDPAERRRLYHYGFPPHLGRRFEAVVDPIRVLIEGAADYGSWTDAQRYDRFRALGALMTGDRGYGFKVKDTAGATAILENWTSVLAWWLNLPGVDGPEPDALRAWQRFVSENLEFRLGVAIGAVIAKAWTEGVDDPLTAPNLEAWRETTKLPWFGFWARELLRWGTLDPLVAFALSQGLETTRGTAAQRRPEFEAWLSDNLDNPGAEDLIDPQLFLRWRRSLPRSSAGEDYSREFDARLTWASGGKPAYAVVPVKGGTTIAWLDPGGFELARSELPEDRVSGLTSRSDYELRATATGATVTRRFDGRRMG